MVQVDIRDAGDPQVLEVGPESGHDEVVARDLDGGRLDEEAVPEGGGAEQTGGAEHELAAGERDRHAERYTGLYGEALWNVPPGLGFRGAADRSLTCGESSGRLVPGYIWRPVTLEQGVARLEPWETRRRMCSGIAGTRSVRR